MTNEQIIAVISAASVAILAVAFLRARWRRALPGRAVTQELRLQLLTASPSEFGISVESGNAWAVVMDTTYPNGSASLISASDGSASLYFSSGGGVIGGQTHPEVNAAAKRFVREATAHIPSLGPATTFPLPKLQWTRFYIRTPEGVLTAEAAEAELGSGKHSLSQLFFAGQAVITQLRLVTERRGDIGVRS